MVQRNNFGVLSDEEISKYKFNFCKNCPFYECELVGEYAQFRESHVQIHCKSQAPTVNCVAADSFDHTKNDSIVIQGIAVSVECNEQDSSTYIEDSLCSTGTNADILSYDQSKLEDYCVMKRNIYQVECGRKTVTEGIGNHYEIEITEKLKKNGLSWEKIIKEDTEER